MKSAQWRLAEGRWPAGLLAAALALALALAGVRLNLFADAGLNLVASLAWLAAIIGGFAMLDSRSGLAAGVGSIGSLFYLWLGIRFGPPPALGLSTAALAVSLALFFANARFSASAATNRIGQGLEGALLGIAAVLFRLPTSPAPDVLLGVHIFNLSNWMVPGVVLGVPIVEAVLPVVQRVRRRLGLASATETGGLVEHLAAQFGVGAARIVPAIWLAGGLLGVAGLALTGLRPLPAHVCLGALLLAVAAALNYRNLIAVGWGPLLVYGIAGSVLLLFVASLKYRMLNRLFPGVMPGNIGWDFFTIPRAFDYMLHGVTMYQRAPEIYQSHYGPYATEPFSPHPLLAVLPGGLLFLLPPDISYTAFVAFSVAALVYLCWRFAQFAASAWQRSLIALFLFASWPLYGMLWMGQMHIFPVIAYGLIGIGLLAGSADKPGWEAPFVAGFLISLFSKPMVLLLLPVILVARPTRKPALVILSVYAVVSLVFIVVPPLNPGQLPLSDLLAGRVTQTEFLTSANLYHWVYLLSRGRWLATSWREVFSLPVLLNVVAPDGVALRTGQFLMGSLVGYLIGSVARVRSRRWSLLLVALAVLMVNAAYFYSYSLIFEYQYTTLAVIPVGLLLLRSRTTDPLLRRYYLAGLILYVPFLLPSAYGLVVPHPVPDVFWDYSGETLRQMTLYRASRVLPVLGMGIALLLAAGRARVLAEQAGADLSPAVAT